METMGQLCYNSKMETKNNMDGQQHISTAMKLQEPDELKTLLDGVAVKGNETLPSDDETARGFSQTFKRLFDARKPHPRDELEVQLFAAVEEALNKSPESITKTDVEALVGFIYSIDEGRDEEKIADGVQLLEARHFCETPKLIEKWQTKNCVGAAMLLTSILKERGVEAYFANPEGHAVSLVRLQDGTLLYADPSNGVKESKGICVDVTKGKLSMGSAAGISLLRLPSASCTPEQYSLVPFHRSLKVGYEHCIKENTDEFVVKEKDKPTLFALKEMGSEVEWGLQQCRFSEEMMRVLQTDAWKVEKEHVAKVTDFQKGWDALIEDIGENAAQDIKNLIVTDKETSTFYVQLLTSPPSKIASEYVEALRMKLPPSIPVSKFLEAHDAFWTATQGLRGISPNTFVKAVEQRLQ